MPSQVRSPSLVLQNFAFADPANVFASDDQYAIATSDVELVASLVLAGFGFAIPGAAQVEGITVRVERRASHDDVDFVFDQLLRLRNADGQITGDNKADAAHWPAIEAVKAYGGENDLWGLAAGDRTPARINHADFGLNLKPQLQSFGASLSAEIDHVEVEIFYDFPAGGGSQDGAFLLGMIG